MFILSSIYARYGPLFGETANNARVGRGLEPMQSCPPTGLLAGFSNSHASPLSLPLSPAAIEAPYLHLRPMNESDSMPLATWKSCSWPAHFPQSRASGATNSSTCEPLKIPLVCRHAPLFRADACSSAVQQRALSPSLASPFVKFRPLHIEAGILFSSFFSTIQ